MPNPQHAILTNLAKYQWYTHFSRTEGADLSVIKKALSDVRAAGSNTGVTSIVNVCILFEVPYRDELIGDPVKRALHGGVISMVADTAGGFAVWSALDDDRSRISTIDLRVDYLLPGKQEPLRAHATLVRAGKAVGVADVRMYHPSSESETIATGKGVYAIRRGKEPQVTG